jgi:hypothetical protein
MPPSLSGGLLCATAAVAASASTDANTPENTRFIEASLRTCRIPCDLNFSCGDHAVSHRQRQAARHQRVMQTLWMARIFRKTE